MKLKWFKKDVSMPRRVAGVGILKYRLLAFLADTAETREVVVDTLS